MHGYRVACIVVLERERVPVLSGGASEYHQPQMGCSPPTSPLLNRLVFVRQLIVRSRQLGAARQAASAQGSLVRWLQGDHQADGSNCRGHLMGILLTIMLAPLALVLGVLLVRFVFSPIGIICVFGLVLFVIIAMKTGPTLPDRASRRG